MPPGLAQRGPRWCVAPRMIAPPHMRVGGPCGDRPDRTTPRTSSPPATLLTHGCLRDLWSVVRPPGLAQRGPRWSGGAHLMVPRIHVPRGHLGSVPEATPPPYPVMQPHPLQMHTSPTRGQCLCPQARPALRAMERRGGSDGARTHTVGGPPGSAPCDRLHYSDSEGGTKHAASKKPHTETNHQHVHGHDRAPQCPATTPLACHSQLNREKPRKPVPTKLRTYYHWAGMPPKSGLRHVAHGGSPNGFRTAASHSMQATL
jgi:hypothetical protein